MRVTVLLLFLSLVTTGASAAAKVPSYADCHPDCLVLYPGEIKVTWSELQQRGNVFEKLLDKIQENTSREYLIVMVRPGSVKFYRMVRKIVGQRPIDVGYDAVDADFKVNWDEAIKAMAVEQAGPKPRKSSVKPTPRGFSSTQKFVFFECRGNQVFVVGKDGLDAQVAKVFSEIDPNIRKAGPEEFLRALNGKNLGNEYYTLKPSYLLMSVLALEPRPNVSGEARDQVTEPSGKFQTELSRLDPQAHYIAFLIRNDSFDIFRQARIIAAERGFNTGWELLGADEPIKFGSGGMTQLGY